MRRIEEGEAQVERLSQKATGCDLRNPFPCQSRTVSKFARCQFGRTDVLHHQRSLSYRNSDSRTAGFKSIGSLAKPRVHHLQRPVAEHFSGAGIARNLPRTTVLWSLIFFQRQTGRNSQSIACCPNTRHLDPRSTPRVENDDPPTPATIPIPKTNDNSKGTFSDFDQI
jgi:hypothetical protein